MPRCQERNNSRLRRISDGEVTWRPLGCALGGTPRADIDIVCASRHPRQAVCAGNGALRHRLAARPSCSSASPARSSSTSSGICRAALSTDAPRRRSARCEPDQIATIAVRVEAHQPGFGRRPYRVLCTDNTGTLTLVYFNVKGDQLARLLPIGAERVVSGRVEFYGGIPQIAHPDLVLRPDELDRLQADRAGLPADRGSLAARRAEGGRGGARPAPGIAGMDRSGAARAAWLAGLGRCGPPRACSRRPRPISCRRPRRASGSPMTRSLRASSRWRWSVPGVIGKRGGRSSAPAALTRPVEAALGFALTGAQRLAIAEIAAEMAQPRAHGAAAAGRCRQRQDGRRADCDADRDRGRRPGGADGADRDPRPPASCDIAAPCRSGARRDRVSDRARKRASPRLDAGEPRLGPDPGSRRHARALTAGCRVSRSRARRDRRTAPLRRRAAPRALREGPRCRHPADERDSDPAHPDDDRLRRSRRLAADRKAAGTASGRHADRGARAHRRRRRGGRPCSGAKGQSLLDLPDGRGKRDRRPRRRRGAVQDAGAALPRPRRPGARAHEAGRQRPRNGRFRGRASSICWSRRR